MEEILATKKGALIQDIAFDCMHEMLDCQNVIDKPFEC